MEAKIMVVPGKIARVENTGFTSFTVLDACRIAAEQVSNVDWIGLAKDREVRVQNRKFSNTEEVAEGTFGSIHTTALNDGDVVLILTKIKGNDAVITCWVDRTEYALETPVEAKIVLTEVVGINLVDVESIRVNGEIAELTRLVGQSDQVEVAYRRQPEVEPPAPASADLSILAPVQEYISGLEMTVNTLHSRIAELEEAEPEQVPTVIFGRLDGLLRTVETDGDDTIQDLCDEHGNPGKFEVVFYNGRPIVENDLDEIYIRDGDSILIVPLLNNAG